MIEKNRVFPVGKIHKPHGINGEMSFTFTSDVFDTEHAEYFIFEMEGILVPFYIESYRFRTDTAALLKLEGVDTEEQAREFSGLEVFLPDSFLDKAGEEEMTMDYFVGFELSDKKSGILGTVTAVDQSTENILFVAANGPNELLIPAAEDFILEIDHEQKIIYMEIPDGLTDLQNLRDCEII